LLIQPRSLLKRVYPRAIWNFGRDKKSIYLTFDDGPIPALTEWVLDELKKHDVKATFFCVGDNIVRHPGIYERIQQEGHRVGNHTMHHPKGFKRSVSAYMKEVEDCRSLVQNTLFRPPYGQLRPGQYRALIRRGYRIVLWDVISYDYEPISEDQCARNVIKNTKPGSIVLFHDNIKAEKNLKHVLPLFISHFIGLGYSFKTL
jgi:peptidoglycan/xylan/chitin deacetylase (PgdA/CDA1 family)